MMRNYPLESEIPYKLSPPIQFVYRSTAQLAGMSYVWNDAPSPLYFPIAGSAGARERKILPTVLYYIRDISVSADIDEADYTSTISDNTTSPDCIPYLSLHLRSAGSVSMLREPFVIPKYFQNFQYRLFFTTTQNNDELRGSFRGKIDQNLSLIGKSEITLTAVMSVQEIVDQQYIQAFMRGVSR